MALDLKIFFSNLKKKGMSSIVHNILSRHQGRPGARTMLQDSKAGKEYCHDLLLMILELSYHCTHTTVWPIQLRLPHKPGLPKMQRYRERHVREDLTNLMEEYIRKCLNLTRAAKTPQQIQSGRQRQHKATTMIHHVMRLLRTIITEANATLHGYEIMRMFDIWIVLTATLFNLVMPPGVQFSSQDTRNWLDVNISPHLRAIENPQSSQQVRTARRNALLNILLPQLEEHFTQKLVQKKQQGVPPPL